MVKQHLISNPETLLRLEALESKLAEHERIARERGCRLPDIATQQYEKDIAQLWANVAMNCPEYDYPDNENQ